MAGVYPRAGRRGAGPGCIYYATALTLVGLNFGLAIGLIGGLFSFMPFVGFAAGLRAVDGHCAWCSSGPNWWFIVIVFAIYMIGQFIEGNVLYPKLVGSSININPVWLMFALFAFGAAVRLCRPAAGGAAGGDRGGADPLWRCANTRRARSIAGRMVVPRWPTPARPEADEPLDDRTGQLRLRARPYAPAWGGRFPRRAKATALAHGRIMAFPDWPEPLTLIAGPAKSGKSHLAADLRRPGRRATMPAPGRSGAAGARGRAAPAGDRGCRPGRL